MTHPLICGLVGGMEGEERLPSDSPMGPAITWTLQADQAKPFRPGDHIPARQGPLAMAAVHGA